MTPRQLNRDIKRLNLALKNFPKSNDGTLDLYFDFVNNYCAKEFKRLYNADSQFKYMNKESVLILLRLNSKHRFIPLHTFGLNIEL